VRVHTEKDFWSLCRVHTHGKGATWRQPVDLGAPGGVPVGSFAVRGRARPHGKGAHGNECGARQCRAHGKDLWRTAKNWRTAASLPHDKGVAHGIDGNARQRPLPCIPCTRTAKMALPSKTLPGNLCREGTHGKAVAVRIGLFAVQSGARQRLAFP
jgi:hypothetical protein